MTEGRRFDEQQVSRILERAVEMQSAQRELPTESGPGMSLAELEQVAREAGLDPALVRRAAAELDTTRPVTPPNPFLGAPTRVVAERVIDGEVPDAEFPELVSIIQRETGDIGQPSGLGRSLTWHASPGVYGPRHRARTRQIVVSVVPKDGRTVIRVEEALGHVAGGLFGGLMGGFGGSGVGIGVGIGIGALHAPLIAAGIIGGAVGGSYLLARTIFRWTAGRRTAGAHQLADRLAEYVARTAVRAGG